MARIRNHVLIVLTLVLAGSATAEWTDNEGAGWGTARETALARIIALQEHHARLRALRTLQHALERYDDVAVARAEGYASTGACLAAAEGGLGVAFTRAGPPVSPADVHRAPHLLTYEPQHDGALVLVGAQFAVLRDVWHRDVSTVRPLFHGQPFALVDHLFDEPAYVLFVWFTAPNPAGPFAAWHPDVSCAHAELVEHGVLVEEDTGVRGTSDLP